MNFFMPRNLEELADALKEKDENTYLCAGGTDLVIHLRARKKFHYSLIDLTHLEEIKKIEETQDEILIGAAVTMTQLEKSPVIRKYIPALAKAASMVGSTQIRNRATVGGNVANASQSSDTTPVLLAYGAEAVVYNEKGEKRTAPVDDLIEGLEKNLLKDREMLLQFVVKKGTARSGFAKVGSRKAVTISKINGCVKTELIDGKMQQATVYLGAVGAKASRAPLIEEALEGESPADICMEKLKEAVYGQIEANIPTRASKHYKKSAALGLMDDILEDLRADAGEVER